MQTELTQIVPTRAGYDGWAKVYDTEDNPLVRLEEEHIGSLIGNVSGIRLIDLGCGTGRHALPLAQAGARITAVDFSEGMLARAQAKPGAEAINFLRHDLKNALPLAASSFDVVLCSLVLDHVQNLNAFFAETHRLCRPGGAIVISVMHPAMLLKGVQARFIEPETGDRIGPASYPHQISDYLMAGVRAGLALDSIAEYTVDSRLAAQSPRACRYLGWPLLLLMRLRRLKSR